MDFNFLSYLKGELYAPLHITYLTVTCFSSDRKEIPRVITVISQSSHKDHPTIIFRDNLQIKQKLNGNKTSEALKCKTKIFKFSLTLLCNYEVWKCWSENNNTQRCYGYLKVKQVIQCWSRAKVFNFLSRISAFFSLVVFTLNLLFSWSFHFSTRHPSRSINLKIKK